MAQESFTERYWHAPIGNLIQAHKDGKAQGVFSSLIRIWTGENQRTASETGKRNDMAQRLTLLDSGRLDILASLLTALDDANDRNGQAMKMSFRVYAQGDKAILIGLDRLIADMSAALPGNLAGNASAATSWTRDSDWSVRLPSEGASLPMPGPIGRAWEKIWSEVVTPFISNAGKIRIDTSIASNEVASAAASLLDAIVINTRGQKIHTMADRSERLLKAVRKLNDISGHESLACTMVQNALGRHMPDNIARIEQLFTSNTIGMLHHIAPHDQVTVDKALTLIDTAPHRERGARFAAIALAGIAVATHIRASLKDQEISKHRHALTVGQHRFRRPDQSENEFMAAGLVRLHKTKRKQLAKLLAVPEKFEKLMNRLGDLYKSENKTVPTH